jgi:hypothetical protein
VRAHISRRRAHSMEEGAHARGGCTFLREGPSSHGRVLYLMESLHSPA